MTSTDTAGHPDVAEISDLAEGLLSPSRSADLRRHLDACELCAEVEASLDEIRGLLGTLPAPPAMPDDVAHRIEAALAGETSLNAGRQSEPDTTTLHEGVTRVSRETSPSRPAGHASSTGTGPGRKERKRAGRRKAVLLGAALAAAVGLGAILVPALTGTEGPGSAPQEQRTTAADTFSASKLEQQVTNLLAGSQGSRTPHSMGVQDEPGVNSPRVFHQPTVPACVQQGIGRSDSALALEEGTYQGKEALLVVLPDASDGTRVTAYLMDATCRKDPSVGAAKILLKDSYTRP
ncbi:anti-sigma factor [Streptomyces sp. BK239]|uniref:anti-sigma factor family protein n=1 Tax=Streptomyces sp. BK239 TaxID=2512155 RepID=UPI00102BB84F|nr:hypothetical protein [Streptomyces sp. BK239]RZU21973.1 hypothetical protein EV567_2484 [Streptomyces sp. BK239]